MRPWPCLLQLQLHGGIRSVSGALAIWTYACSRVGAGAGQPSNPRQQQVMSSRLACG